MRPVRPRRLLGVCLLVGLLQACGGVSQSEPTPGATSTNPEVPTGYHVFGCETITLLGPTGDRVDLDNVIWGLPDGSPAWRTRQLGSCVYVTSLPDPELPGHRPPDLDYVMCDGAVAVDFTLTVRCITMDGSMAGPFGVQTWALEFTDDGSLRLRPGPGAEAMVPFDPETNRPAPPGNEPT